MRYITRQAARYEDMSRLGKLQLIQQLDGDIIVCVVSGDEDDEMPMMATVEFCMPLTGGGQSERTHRALVALLEAMEADNKERAQRRNKHQGDKP